MTELGTDARALLELVGAGPKSHLALMKALGWDRNRYEPARKELLDAEEVAPYRCRGGGLQIRQIVELPAVDETELEHAKGEAEKKAGEVEILERSERDIYPYVEGRALGPGWTRVEIVGDLRRRDWWENPDLVALDEVELDWLLGPADEVTTFEVKLVDKLRLPMSWIGSWMTIPQSSSFRIRTGKLFESQPPETAWSWAPCEGSYPLGRNLGEGLFDRNSEYGRGVPGPT